MPALGAWHARQGSRARDGQTDGRNGGRPDDRGAGSLCHACHANIASMASTSDAELLAFAEKNLQQAQELVGWQIDGFVGGDDAWSTVHKKGGKILDQGRRGPIDVLRRAAGLVRDAARAGLSKASDATKDTRDKLSGLALAAGILAAGASILANPAVWTLLVFLAIEQSGWGKRARSAGRRYVDRRAREYGV